MSKPTKRVRVRVTIDYQMTESRAARVKSILMHVITAFIKSPYPYEYISQGKGDYIAIQFSEPKGDK